MFSEWSLQNPGCLCALLESLLTQYKQHHKALTSQSQRLHFELQSLLQSGDYSDVDVYCSRPDEVLYYIVAVLVNVMLYYIPIVAYLLLFFF